MLGCQQLDNGQVKENEKTGSPGSFIASPEKMYKLGGTFLTVDIAKAVVYSG